MSVLIETSLGVVVIDIYVEARPRCALNFIKLCRLKYYNFCLFHSVQKNLVAQTGDPTGSGRGGASVYELIYGEQARFFSAEKKPKIPYSRRGLVSMVDNGNGQHGSQFFITLADQLDYLDGKHTVFGYVSEGQEFLDRINDVYCDKDSRPFRNVRIHHTIVLDDPFENPKGLTFPRSPTRVPITIRGEIGPPRIEEDEELEEDAGLSPNQVGEFKAAQEEKTHAQLLALIGDLPDPNVKPPDNVLFVCRLNPVTKSEDLEIIFSRFGEIKSCEVIRDKRTGASLQYAFIEFESESDCENAFFKMDKVVIDDRRIHVDFSQSVAKEWKRHREQQDHSRPNRKLPSEPRGDRSPLQRSDKRLVEGRSDHRCSSRTVGRYERHTRHSPARRCGGHSDDRAGVHRRSLPSRPAPRRDDDRTRRSQDRSPPKQRRRSSSPPKRVLERPEPEKHKPLPGTDLDLVISESDIDSSLNSSSDDSSSHIRKKRKKHKHRTGSHDDHKHKHGHHRKKAKRSEKREHKKRAHPRD
ncbi:Peptidyl prolyl cis trans isomerase 4 like [Fasciola gigantica]|uniref:Peptidyl-prolyl cis-trans isomerase n=1 Tax=Fasciola gigantica TaxID=46835 RepID=A0A504Y8R9_FASGI|nr:Peptidyl prolyl cis trans isomerase 4 like [Fasciola gigantica]